MPATYTKSFDHCRACGKDIDTSRGHGSFNQHLSRHNNPSSPLCNKWYQPYFVKVSRLTSTCIICDEEIYHEEHSPFSHHQYIDHLKSHGVTEETSQFKQGGVR